MESLMGSLENHSIEQLETMLEAGLEVLGSHSVLARTGDNIVGELLPDDGKFYEFDHCPPGDIFDAQTHCQYYYHSHRAGEHGHFHIFMRQEGMPKDCKPINQSKADYMKKEDNNLCHLVAISMDKRGIPIALFTTNRWVTAEHWYQAKDVLAMIDRFAIEHAKPSWAVNRWVTAMLRLFRPQIKGILQERDKTVAKWQKDHPDEDVFEDRNLDLPSKVGISVDRQMKALQKALKARRRYQSRIPKSAQRT